MIDIRSKTPEELFNLNQRGLVRRLYIPEYRVWQGMKDRCYNPNNNRYQDYAGRGIAIYEPWQRDFWAFFRHVGRRPSEGHWIDRIDNDAGYSPGNVRWVTPKVSSYNQRKDKLTNLTTEAVEHIRAARGGPLTQADLAEIYGVSRSQVGTTQLGKHHNPDGAYERPPNATQARVGERNGAALLSNAQVADIKGLLLKGYSGPLIAQRFGVHRDVISRIASGQTWRDIEPNLNATLPPFPHGATITRRSLAGGVAL